MTVAKPAVQGRGLGNMVACVAGLAGSVAAAQGIGLLVDGAAVPTAVLARAAVLAVPQALGAVALVLVWRTSRVVNFAGPAVGGLAAVAAVVMANVWHWWFPVAALVAVAAAAALGIIVELVFVRRFVRSSRLVLTVATVAVAQLVAAAAVLLPDAATPESQKVVNEFGERVVTPAVLAAPATPFGGWRFESRPVTFSGDHLVLVAVAAVALAGLALVSRRRRIGMAARAVAGDRERALLWGVPAGNVSSLVWAAATALSALGPVLSAPLEGVRVDAASLAGVAAAAGPGVVLAVLAAALFGRLERPAVAASAAIALGVLRQGILWSTGRPELQAVVTGLAVVAGLVMMRRRRAAARGGSAADDVWFAADAVRPVPAVLASLPEVVAARGRVMAVAVAAGLVAPWALSPSQLYTATTFVLLGVVVASIVMLTGWAGQASLGQLAFAAVGAVAAGHLRASVGLPFPVAVAGGVAAAGAVGFALSVPALRLRGPFLAVASLALAVVVADWALAEPVADWVLPGAITRPELFGLSFGEGRAWYLLCLAALAAVLLGGQRLRRSPLGLALVAARDNDAAAEALGVDVVRSRVIATVAACAVAGLGGAMLAHHQLGVRPDSYGAAASIEVFLMAVVGGLGSLPGALLGAGYFAVVELTLDGIGASFLASGALVLVILMYFPAGLAGGVLAARDVWLRRVATARGLAVRSLGVVAPDGAEPVPLAPATTPIGSLAGRDYRLVSRVRLAGASQRGPKVGAGR